MTTEGPTEGPTEADARAKLADKFKEVETAYNDAIERHAPKEITEPLAKRMREISKLLEVAREKDLGL